LKIKVNRNVNYSGKLFKAGEIAEVEEKYETQMKKFGTVVEEVGVDESEETSNEAVESVKRDVKNDAKDDKPGKVACQYCEKKYSAKGVKRHEASCDKNPDNE